MLINFGPIKLINFLLFWSCLRTSCIYQLVCPRQWYYFWASCSLCLWHSTEIPLYLNYREYRNNLYTYTTPEIKLWFNHLIPVFLLQNNICELTTHIIKFWFNLCVSVVNSKRLLFVCKTCFKWWQIFWLYTNIFKDILYMMTLLFMCV